MIFLVAFVVGSVVIYSAAPVVAPWVVAYFRGEEEPVPEGVAVVASAQDGEARGASEVSAPARPAVAAQRAAEADDVSPALEGVYLARANEQPGWGVTSHRVSYYKADGSYAGTVEGGVLFDCARTITSSKGAMVECRFLGEGVPEGLFLVGRKDAQFFTASHERLSKARIRALKDYYALNGKIEARRAEVLESGAARSPHFAAARAAHEAYQKHIQEARRLEQMRDRLADGERMRLEDQLRELKLKEVVLKKTFEEAQEKYTAWKKAHADELPKPEDDADIKRWAQEKRQLAAALPGLAY